MSKVPIPSDKQVAARDRRGVRHYLKKHKTPFLASLRSSELPKKYFESLSKSLSALIRYYLATPESCRRFLDGVPDAIAGCPQPHHFDVFENIVAYAYAHFLDRYLRVWRVLEELIKRRILPLPRRLEVLDVGSGPAMALYAVHDFLTELRSYGATHSIDRLANFEFRLGPIEQSEGMCRFFHHLSEYDKRNGPFGPQFRDFLQFDPSYIRQNAKLDELDAWWDSDSVSSFLSPMSIADWSNQLARFQLVISNNFLTTPEIVEAHRNNIASLFENQLPGGTVVIMGAWRGTKYEKIYAELDEIATRSGHRRIDACPILIDDSTRRPFLESIKQFWMQIWDHVASQIDVTEYKAKKDYRVFWDEAERLARLPTFALHIFHRASWRRLRNITASQTSS